MIAALIGNDGLVAITVTEKYNNFQALLRRDQIEQIAVITGFGSDPFFIRWHRRCGHGGVRCRAAGFIAKLGSIPRRLRRSKKMV